MSTKIVSSSLDNTARSLVPQETAIACPSGNYIVSSGMGVSGISVPFYILSAVLGFMVATRSAYRDVSSMR